MVLLLNIIFWFILKLEEQKKSFIFRFFFQKIHKLPLSRPNRGPSGKFSV